MSQKNIVVLGSTGSIGRQTLEVVEEQSNQLKVVALVAGSQWQQLVDQTIRFRPKAVALFDQEAAELASQKLREAEINIPVYWGMDGLCRLSAMEEAHTIVTAVSGSIGLRPTLTAIEAGKQIALANKETLVAAGPIVMAEAQKRGVMITPVDSEHSALFQCLAGHDKDKNDIQLILTASGGPFREYSREQLSRVTAAQALKHPNWNMGAKITIDSATLMNKGLEVIEARWLFDVDYSHIQVLIHPQSIVHSLVEFADGSVLAQLGLPDMKLPIQYALSYPKRWKTDWQRLNLREIHKLTFEEPDNERFPCLALALEAGKAAGTMPAVLNAANEVAVHGFLNQNCGFYDIPGIINKTMQQHQWSRFPELKDILEADRWAREKAMSLLKEGSH